MSYRIACIDLGGTMIKSGLWDGSTLSHTQQTPTHAQEGAQAVLDRVITLVRAMGPIDGVGLSTAGEVEPESGRILLCDNIPGYTGMEVGRLLTQELGVPAAVENDVNAAALGEAFHGAAQGARHSLMVSYGTGVGGACILNGQLYRGMASAGEFGGMLVHPEDLQVDDRGSGSYERYASTTALVRMARELDSTLTDGRAIFARLAEPAVSQLVDRWCGEVALGLVGLIHAFAPERVILGGGVMEAPQVLPRVEARVHPLLKSSFLGCRLAAAQLGNRASMIGMGCTVQQNLN